MSRLRPVLIGSLFLVLAFVSAHAQGIRPATSKDEGSLASGYQLLADARYVEALNVFRGVLEKTPRDAAAMYGAALALFNLKQLAEAESLAQSATDVLLASISALPPNDPRIIEQKSRAADALVLLALTLAVRGRNTEALRATERAATLLPSHFDAQFALGRARYGEGDLPGAARAFQVAVSLRPEDQKARLFLASALERSGQLDSALTTYRELVARHPNNAEGRVGLGSMLLKRNAAERDVGMAELKRAIELAPDLYLARITIGKALLARGKAQEAVAHLERAATIAPSNPEPHFQLSLAYRKLGRKEEAAKESAIVKSIHEARRKGARSIGTPNN